ncbi:anti-sigma factor [Segnochrobactraceae bacterium EtOH-i3]
MTTEAEEAGAIPDDLLAAEFVLGVLDTDQWTATEARRQADPAFAEIVTDWEQRLADLADAVPSVPPPARIHRRVEAELSLLIARMPAPEPEPEPAPPPPRRGVPFWRGLACGTGALAALAVAGLAVVLFLPHSGVQTFLPRSVDVATLVPAGMLDEVLFVVAVDHERQEVLLTPIGTVPADRVPELWYLSPGEAPHTLGVFSAAMPRVLRLPDFLGAMSSTDLRGARLAVSLEPPGGSPTGQPGSPFVAEGLLVPTL